jgi:phosphate transport system substrate-binding protein
MTSRPPIALRALLATAIVLGVIALAGCGASGVVSTTQLTVMGSTTLDPITQVAAEQFMAANPGTRVMASGVGSSAGIEAVSKGTCEIGTSSRDLKSAEMTQTVDGVTFSLVETEVARDAIAVIVNPENPVTSLTTSQVADIFAGKIKNWSEVCPPGVTYDYEIGLVNRDEASGTREAFSKLVMKGLDFDPTAAVLPGTGQVRAVVAQSKIAVGYISLGFVKGSPVKALIIDGVTPTEANVANGTYPVKRNLYFITKGEPQGLALRFIRFMLSPEIQDKVVMDGGFLPIGGGD